MKTDVTELFPEVNQIEQESLRSSVKAVWEDAIEIGGWTDKDLDRIPFTLLIPDCKFSLVEHTRAVTRTCLAIAEVLEEAYGGRISIDRDVLIAGAILHDVGKLLEYTEQAGKVVKSSFGTLLRHPFSGQALAFKHGLPPKVLHMIAYHSKEGGLGKRCVEAIIVHHADFVNFEPLRLETL